MKGSSINTLWREPLLQFLFLGGVIFLLYTAFGARDDQVARERIVVDESRLSRLALQFERTWMRTPTHEELQGLANEFVKEEILYREALALGLDKDDLIIRRRLRQKMEFLNADLDVRAPTEEQLADYLQANADTFRLPSRLSFSQIYLDPRRGDAEMRAMSLLERLRASPAQAEAGDLGDRTLLPDHVDNATVREVAQTFGQQLSDAVASTEPGEWFGPERSAYGLHLLRVTAREPARMPTLAEVRSAVEREWTNRRRQDSEERFYGALRSRYTVEIKLPEREQAGSSTHGDALAARR